MRNKRLGIAVVLILMLVMVGLASCRQQSLRGCLCTVDETQAQAYQTSVYLTSGGDKLVVASGGEIEIQSGATADYQEGAAYTLPAADKVAVDGDTTNQTQTAGALDINVGTTTANVNALNVAFTQDNGTAAATDGYAAIFTLTQNDADADMRGIKVSAAATANAAANSYEYGYYFDCAENTAGACLDGVLIASSGANTGLTDGVDVSASNIAYAVNIGSNPILGGDDQVTIGATDDTLKFTRNDSGSVTYTCADDDANATCIYDSGGTGSVQLGTADTTSVDALAGLDVQGGDITLENDEVIKNSYNGAISVTIATNDEWILAADELDVTNGQIVNIGAAGTDFNSSGGLTLADDLVLTAGKSILPTSGITNTGTLFVAYNNVDYNTAEGANHPMFILPANVNIVDFNLTVVTAFDDSGTDTLDCGTTSGDPDEYVDALDASAAGINRMGDAADMVIGALGDVGASDLTVLCKYDGQNNDSSAGSAVLTITYMVD